MELHINFEKYKITNEWFNLNTDFLKDELSKYNYIIVGGYYENKSSIIEGMFSRFNHKKNLNSEDLDFIFYDFIKMLSKNKKYYKTKIKKMLIDYNKGFEKWSPKKIHMKCKDYLEYSAIEHEFGKDHVGRYLIIF